MFLSALCSYVYSIYHSSRTFLLNFFVQAGLLSKFGRTRGQHPQPLLSCISLFVLAPGFI